MGLQEEERDRWKGENLQGTDCGEGLYPERKLIIETFSTVAMIKSIMILLSIAAHMDYEI